MTEAEKIAAVKLLSDETDDAVISVFLSLAGEAIYHYADPYRAKEKDEILERYGDVQAVAAAYYINKRGWDFQLSHSDNGVTRSFEAGDLPDSILRRITPICGAVS